ncbi:methylcrotonoyl-CoA carboxylase beta chain, mitochondrial-like [Saccostrea cucullata]|uniref:methylcrotonoyl-CoA carboxylase beta chain, mitochondrial-like n=1 Tax=Saccostrea cuccullata TaxID=36930 RepID=UPI002ED2B228
MLKPIRVSHLKFVKRYFLSVTLESTHRASVTTLSGSQKFKSSFKIIEDNPLDVADAERNRNKYKLLLENYSKHVALAKSGGGEKAVERHTVKQKKMLVADRLCLLLDDVNDFLELALSAGLGMPYGDVPRAGIITGIGRVHGKLCMIIANDATVKGGTIYPVALKKQLRAQEIAEQNHLPTYYVVESGGAFLPLQSEIFLPGGRTFYNEAVMSSQGIPQLAIVCGNCTAGGAYIPTMADEAVMIHKHGTIFLGGPPLVKAATGEVISAEELGGATLHCSVSGCTDYFAKDEPEAFEMGRDIAETLPFHDSCTSDSEPPLYDADDIPGLITPENNINIYQVISRITDGSKFSEFKKMFGPSLITGFGYIHGCLVGIVGNNGSLSEHSADKGAHFVQLCCERDIPLIFLQNTQEKSDSQTSGEMYGNQLRAHAKMLAAISCANVPVISFIIGNAIGPTSFVMANRCMSPNFLFCWPNAVVCVENPDKLTQDLIEEAKAVNIKDLDTSSISQKVNMESSSFYAASRVWNDGIVLPQDTRRVIRQSLEAVNAYRHRTQPKAQIIRM